MTDTAIQLGLSAFSAIACALVAWLGRKLQQKEDEREQREEQRIIENNAIREGILAILRDRIIQMANYCETKGETPIFMVENMTHMYGAYKSLGGNGAVTAIYTKFMALPHKPAQGGNEDD